jgi:beta-mannosidase
VEAPDSINLSGTWRVAEAVGDLHRRFADRGFDDEAWLTLPVPGHWQSHDKLAATDGPMLYRRRFHAPPPPAGRRAFASFDGVFYYGDVWLDGTYLGATEGYFFTHHFEITQQLRSADEHVVAVEVASPRAGESGVRRAITGVFPELRGNPGGLWRPARVRSTGPVRLARVRTLCAEASETRGRLVVALTLDAAVEAVPRRRPDPLPVRIMLRLADESGTTVAELSRDVSLADGDNHLSIDLDVEQPSRWWPHRLGAQPRYELTVRVEVDDLLSDERRVRTAFRDVRLRRWRLTVNGEPLFIRGSTYPPARSLLAEATADDFRRDVAMAVEANLDLLRVHGHVSRPELYEAADDAGLLLWQDLPLRGRYARTARSQAIRQAREMVDALGQHPSIVLWCGHDEPYDRAAWRALPSWNKDVLDRSVSRALRRADPTRPVDLHSGVPPGPLSAGTDSNLVGGWHDGLLDGLAGTARAVPRLVRFVGAFGAPSVPEGAVPDRPARWPDDDWVREVSRGPYGDDRLAEMVPPAASATYEQWAEATRQYQAALVQLAIEDLRRVKDRPAAGFCHFCLVDTEPAVSCAVVDHQRVPKPAYEALRDACRLVLATIEPRAGAVHVVNDTGDELEGAVVTVRDEHGVRHVWAGTVGADRVVFVGRVADVAGLRGEVTVSLEQPWIGLVENRYSPTLLAHVARGKDHRGLSMLKRASRK